MEWIVLTAVAVLLTIATLAFGAEVGLAAGYQDANHNACEGGG